MGTPSSALAAKFRRGIASIVHPGYPFFLRSTVANQFSRSGNISRQLPHAGTPSLIYENVWPNPLKAQSLNAPLVNNSKRHGGHDRSQDLMNNRRLSYEAYTVGVICAMTFEMSAVRYMYDQEHETLKQKPGDPNIYTFGKLRGHNVVIGCLPGSQGKGSAAITATHMRRTFPAIRHWFLVGIGGGVPSAEDDIRLGDVVVSMPNCQYGGVVQYDSGKETDTGFEPIGFLASPPSILRSAVEKMRSDHMLTENKIGQYVSALEQRGGRLGQYMRPPEDDVLFEQGCTHHLGQDTCDLCDKSRAINRQPRKSAAHVIHYGLIGSADRVMKSPIRRDELGRSFGIKCFEMEAAGVMTDLPALVIRGISDYCDSHKTYKWQRYAAAAASGYLKEFLGYIDTA